MLQGIVFVEISHVLRVKEACEGTWISSEKVSRLRDIESHFLSAVTSRWVQNISAKLRWVRDSIIHGCKGVGEWKANNHTIVDHTTESPLSLSCSDWINISCVNVEKWVSSDRLSQGIADLLNH